MPGGQAPRVHCVVPGGELSSYGTRWVAARPSFFLTIKPLPQLFRRLFLERQQAAFESGRLGFFNKLTRLAIATLSPPLSKACAVSTDHPVESGVTRTRS
ncbi:MAG: transposase [Pseudorhodoplanes sp.]